MNPNEPVSASAKRTSTLPSEMTDPSSTPTKDSQSESEPLYVGRPNLGDRDLFRQLVDEMFARRWFTNNGQIVQRFERELAEYLHVKHCVAVCNATVGLEMVYQALGLRGTAIVPAYTFVATVHALRWVGVRPVFVEPELESHNLDWRQLETAIRPDTSAVIGVHLWGRACDTEAIEAIATRRGIPVIYDAAHAFGCWHRDRPLGGFGACEVFSFHATKFFNTFEGGAITTHDDRLAERLREARNFGFTGPDSVQSLGINGKMTEVCAAMGIANLKEVESFIAVNRRNHALYQRLLQPIPGIRLLDYAEMTKSNWQYIVIEVEETAYGASRDQLHAALAAQGILSKRYFFPGCHRMEPYRTESPEWVARMPRTDQLCQAVLCLPNGTAVDEADIRRVAAVIAAGGKE